MHASLYHNDVNMALNYFVLLLLLVSGHGIWASLQESVDHYSVDLSEHKNEIVHLDCSKTRTGVLVLRNAGCATEDFFVKLRVQYGKECRGYFRFYLSLRNKLLGSSKVVVYDSMYNQRSGHVLGARKSLKAAAGGYPIPSNFIPDLPNYQNNTMPKAKRSVNPDSFLPNIPGSFIPDIPGMIARGVSLGQYFSNRDSVRIEINRDGDCHHGVADPHAEGIVIDFTLVQADREPARRNPGFERYCPSLHGFIPESVMCSEDSRITCPDIFSWANGWFNIPVNLRTMDWCRGNVIPTPEPGFQYDDDDNDSDHDSDHDHDHDHDSNHEPCWRNPFHSHHNCLDPFENDETNEEDQHRARGDDCFSNPLNPHDTKCHRASGNHDTDDSDPDPDGQQPEQDQQDEDGVTKRPHRHRRRWTSHPDFDDDWDVREHNEEDDYTHRPHLYPRHWSAWAVVFISLAVMMVVFVFPVLLCWWCLRSRNQVRYQALVTTSTPTAPAYGTFDNYAVYGGAPYTNPGFRQAAVVPQMTVMPPPYNKQ